MYTRHKMVWCLLSETTSCKLKWYMYYKVKLYHSSSWSFLAISGLLASPLWTHIFFEGSWFISTITDTCHCLMFIHVAVLFILSMSKKVLRKLQLAYVAVNNYFIPVNFWFSFVLNSLAYTTIPRNNGKIKINWNKN